MRFTRLVSTLTALLLGCSLAALAVAADAPSISIPQISQEPTLADFAGMTPASAVAKQMTRIEGFVQREPIDGAAAT